MHRTIRPSIDEMMMDIATMSASRSTCSSRAKVGAVIASKEGRVLSIGYNGVPRGMDHCDDTGCRRGVDDKHLWLVHAEENAIVGAAAEGVRLNDTTMYCTHLPCSHCAALIRQAGITRVVYNYVVGGPVGPTQYVFARGGIELDWIGDLYGTEGSKTKDSTDLGNSRS